jgi:hypothetical protein
MTDSDEPIDGANLPEWPTRLTIGSGAIAYKSVAMTRRGRPSRAHRIRQRGRGGCRTELDAADAEANS